MATTSSATAQRWPVDNLSHGSSAIDRSKVNPVEQLKTRIVD
jgi:hypothetical protein